MIDFIGFPKIARLSRQVTVSEKIDGTNSQICITEDGQFLTGSKNRWITPEDDNYGFSKWAHEHRDELLSLGKGHHYGEWWGLGIQRGYNLKEKRFSLFNTLRWGDVRDRVKYPQDRPSCCYVVPILYEGIFNTFEIDKALLELRRSGSVAASGFYPAEGIVVYHTAANIAFKKTIINDDKHKGEL
jgi:hypothetical protein